MNLTNTYKMVFEKDTDGNYCWVETDIVKKVIYVFSLQ